MRRGWALLVLAMLAVAPAAGKTYPFEATFTLPSLTAETVNLTALAGSVSASTPTVDSAYAFANVTTFEVTGITEIWTYEGPIDPATIGPDTLGPKYTGDLTVRLAAGSVAAFVPGAPVASSLTTGYALAFPLAMDETIADVHVGSSLLALTVDSSLAFSGPIVATGTMTQAGQEGNLAKLLLGKQATAVVLRDGVQVGTVQGAGFSDQHGLLMRGTLTVAPVQAQTVLMPFGTGARGHIEAASGTALTTAIQTINFDQVQKTLDMLRGEDSSTDAPGSSGSGGNGAGGAGDATGGTGAAQGEQPGAPDLGVAQALLVEVLNSGILATNGSPGLAGLTLVRGGSLDVVMVDAYTMQASGDAAFGTQGGRVTGAKGMLGFGWFVLPWWSLALWAVAIGLFIVAMVRKAPKKHEKWDRFRWAGRIATLLAFVLLLYLWDRHVASVLGVSFLSTHATGTTKWVILGVQYLLLTPIMFFVTSPLRLALRSGFRLAGQGTFMGMASPIALLLTYPLGAGLLIDYLGFFLERLGAVA